MPKNIAVCVDDIIFFSKITNAAKAFQIEANSVLGSTDEITERIRQLNPSAILLDMNSKRIDSIKLIQFLKSDIVTTPIPVIGFVSHVDAETRNAAIDAGCDQVLPRSVFVQTLPEILSRI